MNKCGEGVSTDIAINLPEVDALFIFIMSNRKCETNRSFYMIQFANVSIIPRERPQEMMIRILYLEKRILLILDDDVNISLQPLNGFESPHLKSYDKERLHTHLPLETHPPRRTVGNALDVIFIYVLILLLILRAVGGWSLCFHSIRQKKLSI